MCGVVALDFSVDDQRLFSGTYYGKHSMVMKRQLKEESVIKMLMTIGNQKSA
jgi:hypothetical protein